MTEHFHQAGRGCCPHPDCVKVTAPPRGTCQWRGAYSSDRCNSEFVNENGWCKDHDLKCLNCGEHADHGCDYCGQFVCGYPACEKCGACSVDHGAKQDRNHKYRMQVIAAKLREIIDTPDMPSAVVSAATIELGLLQ